MYVLEGPIDDGKMRVQGFPEDVIAAFTSGFPDDWAVILPACLRYGNAWQQGSRAKRAGC
jgi:hypothetical protein